MVGGGSSLVREGVRGRGGRGRGVVGRGGGGGSEEDSFTEMLSPREGGLSSPLSTASTATEREV